MTEAIEPAVNASANQPLDTPSLMHVAFLAAVQAQPHEADGFVDWYNVFYPLEKTRDLQRQILNGIRIDQAGLDFRLGVPRNVMHYMTRMTVGVTACRATGLRAWLAFRFTGDTLVIQVNDNYVKMFNNHIHNVGKRLTDKNAPKPVSLVDVMDSFHSEEKMRTIMRGIVNVVIDGEMHIGGRVQLKALYRYLIEAAENELNFYLVN